MDKNEMVYFDNDYKRSVIAIMNTLVSNLPSPDRDTMGLEDYRKALRNTIIDLMEYNKDIDKDSRIYKLVKRYLYALLYTNISFKTDGKTIWSMYIHNVYSSYDEITIPCTISANVDKSTSLLKNIHVSPYIKVSYNDLGFIYEIPGLCISSEDCSFEICNFYRLYNDFEFNMKKVIINNKNFSHTISNLTGDIETFAQDMAMLLTLFYMKSVVSVKDYSKFLKMSNTIKEEDKKPKNDNDNIVEYINQSIFDINKNLYRIGDKNKRLLRSTIKRINKIIEEICEENKISTK
nr:MAG TPA: hypothetical protein [Caudoviricetes sp.]